MRHNNRGFFVECFGRKPEDHPVPPMRHNNRGFFVKCFGRKPEDHPLPPMRHNNRGWHLFIARHMLSRQRGSMSAPLVSIAIASIALGVLVMVMSVAILHGFQGEITRKVVGFGSHIVVTPLSVDNHYDTPPVSTARPDIARLRSDPNVRHLHAFAIKGGMAKTDSEIHGVLFKGLSSDYDTSFLASCLVSGRLFSQPDSNASTEVIISRTLADKLRLALGDRLRTYFWQGTTYRARAFTIVGIYSTDLADFDDHYIIGDLRQLQAINQWSADQVGGFEITVDDFSQLAATADRLAPLTAYDLQIATIVGQNPALFAWLDLLNSNITLILIIMALVCIVAIISALLIMIFEKASTIGLLKALGATSRDVRRIFIIKSLQIIVLGITIGDAIALALSLLQHHLHIIRLDPASYSMSYVPVDLNPWIFIAISLSSLVACLIAMLIPASQIANIQPARSLRFE